MSLDTRENRRLREEEAARLNEPPPLNPPFPYKFKPIDLPFFDLMVDPEVLLAEVDNPPS